MSTKIPTVTELKVETLALMEEGVTNSHLMRQRLSKKYSVDLKTLRVQDPKRAHQFVNNHAWALVRLQNEGKIKKDATQEYRLTSSDKTEPEIEPPTLGHMPKWAKTLISAANSRNRKKFPTYPVFTQKDMLCLWEECTGQCAITGLQFSNEKVGLGQAKRAFAPSLDRINPEIGYRQDNCRLVMVAVNFAMNSWGEETYLCVAEAAIKNLTSEVDALDSNIADRATTSNFQSRSRG